jgi:hypothetical protein
LRFFGIILLGLVLTFGLVLSAGEGASVLASSDMEINYSGIKTKEDRLAFMERFGVVVDGESEQVEAFRMPKDFDRVILGYNELQKKQGLDLSKYQGKRVTRYTYQLRDDSDCYANLFVYRGKIIAADLTSASPDGYVLPLTLAKK